jgi:hypothetical protein
VLSRIQENVGKRSSRLSGGAERAMVVAAVKNRSMPIEDPIYGASKSRGQALHPIREGRGALRFDQQVDMIVLERVVNHAEVCPLRDCAE